MDSIKSYFEIVFNVFICISIVFISFKVFVFIGQLKKHKKKKLIKGYRNITNNIENKNNEEIYVHRRSAYLGEIKKDKPEGEEILRYDNGDVYKGEFIDGKRSGFGICIFSNKDKYEGLWKDD